MRGRVRLLVVVAVVAAGSIGACSLNPQPIPPGEQADGGSGSDFGSGAETDAATNNPGPGDSGATQGLDSGREGDTGVPSEDAGDASDDAGDAEADADAT